MQLPGEQTVTVTIKQAVKRLDQSPRLSGVLTATPALHVSHINPPCVTPV